MISCSSQVTTSGSNPIFCWNSKNFFDYFLQLLIFLSTKSFRTNTLHPWYAALGVNSCLYFCFSDSHLSKIWAQLVTFDFTSKSFLFTQKYLLLSITSTSHFLYFSLLIWMILYIHKKKIIFFDGIKYSIIFHLSPWFYTIKSHNFIFFHFHFLNCLSSSHLYLSPSIL